MDDFEQVEELSKIANVSVPKAIQEIRTAPVLHNTVVDVEEMPVIVEKILNVS